MRHRRHQRTEEAAGSPPRRPGATVVRRSAAAETRFDGAGTDPWIRGSAAPPFSVSWCLGRYQCRTCHATCHGDWLPSAGMQTDRRPSRLLRHGPRRLPRVRAPDQPRARRAERAHRDGPSGLTRSSIASGSAATSTSNGISPTSRSRDARWSTLKLPEGEWDGGRGERYRHAADDHPRRPSTRVTRSSTRRASSMGRGSGSRTSCCASIRSRVPPCRRSAGRTRWRTPSWRVTPRRPRCSRCARTSSSCKRIQGVQPQWMHVALGGSKRETASFRVADYMAYYRTVKRRFEESVAGEHAWPPRTYPEPVAHCEVCRWDEVCRARRRADDHLSLVAGITTRTRTGAAGIAERARPGVASAGCRCRCPCWSTPRPPALMRVREQARHPGARARTQAQPLYELLEPSPPARMADSSRTRASWRCPSPAPTTCSSTSRATRSRSMTASTTCSASGSRHSSTRRRAARRSTPSGRATRRAASHMPPSDAAFERDHRPDHGPPGDRHPDLHVYHYAPYEPTAFERLMGRYATREVEVDRLFRGEPFVDLYRVVRQGIRASVESYSIKKLEPQYGYVREADLQGCRAAPSRRSRSGSSWAARRATRKQILDLIARYNQDDVISTMRLRDWLEESARRAGHRPSSARGCRGPTPWSARAGPKRGDARGRGCSRSRRSPTRSLVGRAGGREAHRTPGAARPLAAGPAAGLAPARAEGRLVALLPPDRAT